MARALAKKSDGHESDLAFEFEQAPLLTLGVGHESRPRLSGGAYRSISRKTDDFLDDFDEAFDQLPARAEKFNLDRVKHEDMAKASGGPPDEEP